MNSIKEIAEELKKESVNKNNPQKTTSGQFLSKVLPGGEILETIYNLVTQETNIVVCKDGEIEILDGYKSENGSEFLPFPSGHDLLVKNFVKIPSGISDCGDPQKLFLEVKNFVDKYIKLPDEFLTVSTVYILLTWVYDCFHTLPYLRVLGDYGTGKTRFQEIMGNVCYKAMLAGGSTSKAAVFRTINLIQGTFVFDEADFKSSDMWSDIIKILNSGHTKGFPVIRMHVEKDKMTTEVFEVYGPKVLASRERFGDEALESRCLTQNLFQMKDSGRPIHLSKEFESEAETLRNKLLAFRMQNYDKIKVDEDTVKDLSYPRLKQSALALTSLASMIGDDVFFKTKSYLKKYEQELQTNKKRDARADVLLVILDLVKKCFKDKQDKIYMLDIKHGFEMENWDDYGESNRQYRDSSGTVFVYQQRSASAKKIGVYVRNLGIQTSRDGRGFYISISQEIKTIELLADQFGLEKPWETNSVEDDQFKHKKDIEPSSPDF